MYVASILKTAHNQCLEFVLQQAAIPHIQIAFISQLSVMLVQKPVHVLLSRSKVVLKTQNSWMYIRKV